MIGTKVGSTIMSLRTLMGAWDVAHTLVLSIGLINE